MGRRRPPPVQATGRPASAGTPRALPVRKAPGTRPCAQQLRTLLAEMPQSLATFAAEGYVMCISPSAKSNASPRLSGLRFSPPSARKHVEVDFCYD